jgi:hypothetical protein
MYKITNYSKQQAKKLGVQIKPSTLKNKKIDVFKGDQKIASIGALGFGDYPTYIKEFGREYADDRRRLYKLRHEKYRHIKDTPSFYADKILW